MTVNTTNYSFKKEALGHPERDTAMGANLDLIDAAIKTVSDTVGDFGPLASAKVVVGNSEGAAAAVDMSGDITIGNTGVTAIGAGKALIANMEAALLKGIVTVPLSFETNEQTATKIYFPFKVVVTKIRSIVVKQIGATADGTVTGNNGVGDAVVTIAAESALNTEDSVEPSAVNGAVAADAAYTLTSAKGATAAGKVLVTLEYTQTA
jgi:hypothetical protein